MNGRIGEIEIVEGEVGRGIGVDGGMELYYISECTW